jgi:hypothetical protein
VGGFQGDKFDEFRFGERCNLVHRSQAKAIDFLFSLYISPNLQGQDDEPKEVRGAACLRCRAAQGILRHHKCVCFARMLCVSLSYD